jgi:NADH-quinone oxidoreductase subunit M
MSIGLFSLWYGALAAFRQTDSKMVIAYATISHVGFMLMAIFSPPTVSYFGIIILVFAHSLSSIGILMLIDYINEQSMLKGVKALGLWQHNPKISFFLLTFLLASLGLPLFGNFLGEWLSLWGIYYESPLLSFLAAMAMIPSAIYCLWLFKSLCLSSNEIAVINDLPHANMLVYGCIMAALIFLGLCPSYIASLLEPISAIQQGNL